MLFGAKKDHVQYGVLFEIGSGSIGAAIVLTNSQSKSPVILYETREFISLKQTKISEDITRRLLSSFMSVALEIQASIPQYIPPNARLSAAYINFTAPWSYTRSSVHTYENKEPVLITEKLLKQIKATASEKLSNDSPAEGVLKDKDFSVIHQVTTGYTANFYPIMNPVGQAAKSVSITETISIVNNTVYLPIAEMTKKLFTAVPIFFSASSLVHQYLLQTQISVQSTFCVIHLTYEAIELTLYRDKKIVTAFNTGIGINTLARNIAELSKLPQEQVLAFLTATDTNSFQETVQKKIQAAFVESIQKPLTDFFTKAHSLELLPHEFYFVSTLTPSSMLIKFIKTALSTSASAKFTLKNLCLPSLNNDKETNLANNDVGICTLAHFFHSTQIKN
jgi:hypothetical protein